MSRIVEAITSFMWRFVIVDVSRPISRANFLCIYLSICGMVSSWIESLIDSIDAYDVPSIKQEKHRTMHYRYDIRMLRNWKNVFRYGIRMLRNWKNVFRRN